MATDNSFAERLQAWWLEQMGTAPNEEQRLTLLDLLRNEVQRQHSTAAQLSDTALQRLRSSRRLAITKLDNIEANLRQCHQQAQRLEQFIELKTELDTAQAHLYSIGKQQASLLTQQQELARFEEFEPLSPLFQQLSLLAQRVATMRNSVALESPQLAEKQQTLSQATQQLDAADNELRNAVDALTAAAYTMTEASRQQATADASRDAMQLLQTTLDSLRERSQRLQSHLQEADNLISLRSQTLTDTRSTLQGLEAHRPMLESSAAILVQLDELAVAMHTRDGLSAQLQLAIRQQNERDEQLSRLFRDHEELKAALATKQAEAANHRQQLAGQDSYAMQRRALELRSRCLMFETAFSLWQSIAEGFEQMEEKERVITQLRQHIDLLHRTTDALTTEVRQLQAQLQQRRHHWTMAKSQNVIELRSDLHEGTTCAVCGSTHHPWHSESMGEQSALIASLKADVDSISATLDNRRNNLHEQLSQMAADEARIEVEAANLQRIAERQQRDMAEWAHFSTLDPSLRDCSRSTNRQARTATLRQLIEKTKHDADQAERDLETMTFHLDAIATLGDDIQQLQRRATDLSNTMGEVNTACQVMAGQADRLAKRLKTATQDYSRRYDTLAHAITLPEWFQQWKAAPESVKMHIQQLATQWQQATTEAQSLASQLDTLHARRELIRQYLEQTLLDINQSESTQARLDDTASKADDSRQRLLPYSVDARTHFTNQLAHHAEQQQQRADAQHNFEQQLNDNLAATAHIQQLQEQIDLAETTAADLRQQLDLAIRRYNANHPPVQAAELSRVFADGRDWTDIRQEVRRLSIDNAVTTSRVDNLRARIVALQTEGLRAIADDGQQEQQRLNDQQADLEAERKHILMQIARYDAQLADSGATP